MDVVIARIDALDPWRAGTVALPATPAGWPDATHPATVLGAATRDWICTLPSQIAVVDQGPAFGTFLPGKLAEPMNMEIQLVRGGGTGRTLPSFGEIRIDDPDRAFALWSRFAWHGGEVALFASSRHRGVPAQPFARFVVDRVERGRAGASLVARGLDHLFAAPLHRERYGGTGGADGDAAVAGQVKPRAFGALFNVRPKLISALHRVHQIDARPLVSVAAARDGGAALVMAGDFASFEALAAAPLAVDEVATCRALGLVRTGGATVRALTIDCVCGAAYTTAGLVAALLEQSGAAGRIVPPSAGDIAAFDAECPGVVGIHLPDETSVGAALDRIAAGQEIVVWVDFAGKLRLWQPKLPRATSLSVGESWRFPQRLAGEPKRQTWPHRRGTVAAWRANWTVQAPSDLAPALDDAARRLYGQAAQTAAVFASGAAGSDPGAALVSPPALWRDEADARAAAIRSNAIWGRPLELRTADIAFDRAALADLLALVGATVGLSDATAADPDPLDSGGTVETSFGPLVGLAVAWSRGTASVGVLTPPGGLDV